MPLSENLNVSPYYADYNPLADYYSILFKAGFPVQARELTNMQLIQQNQLETFMSRFMKEGDQIVPGERAYASPAYVRLSSITQGATAENFIGSTVTGAVSGVQAVVQFATPETDDDDITFYVSYESQGSTSEYTTFIEGETLLSDTVDSLTATVGVTGVSKPLTIERLGVTTESPAMGRGTIYTVAEGYYFASGTSVRNTAQTITLNKYDTVPTCNVGFVVVEEFINSSEDPALLDNSQGSSNFAAPGADRLKISLVLTQTTDDSEIDNFLQLAQIVQGVIISDPTQQTKWQWLYDILAKRTYDESGDYIITEFPVDLLNYANTEITEGRWNADADGRYPDVRTTDITDTLSYSEANELYVIKVSPGEAYVQGFNVAVNKPVYVFGNKPRQQAFRENVITPITTPFDVVLTNVYNIPDFVNSSESINTQAFDPIVMYRNFNDGYVGESVVQDAGNNIVPINAGKAPPITYHVTLDSDVTADVTDASAGITQIYRGGKGLVVQVPAGTVVARWDGDTSATPADTINTFQTNRRVVEVVKVRPMPTGVLYPRYLYPRRVIPTDIKVGTDSSGNDIIQSVTGYDSTYELGMINSVFFTEFMLVEDTNSAMFKREWIVGDLVYAGAGEKNYATVEAGSRYDLIILSNIVGDIGPGDTLRQGDKTATIPEENDVVGFVFSEFGTGNALADLSVIKRIKVSALGNDIILNENDDFLYISRTNSIATTSNGRRLLRRFPFPPKGSSIFERVTLIALGSSSTSNPITADAVDVIEGHAISYPVQSSNSLSNTKSFFSDLAQTTNFSADIAINNKREVNISLVANGSAFRGEAGTNILRCNTIEGNPGAELVFGDLIAFTDEAGNEVRHIVNFATEPYGSGLDRKKADIFLTTPLVADVRKATVERVRMKSLGEPTNNLIFQLPQRTVASLQSNNKKTSIDYFVVEEFIESVNAGATSVTLNLTAANERFIQGNDNVVVSMAQIGSGNNYETGRQLTVASSSVEDNGRKLTITFETGTTIQSNGSLKILVPIQIVNGKAKIKKLMQNQVLNISTQAEYQKQVISLGKADAVVIKSITAGNQDITQNYNFDTGQTDNYYGISFLVRKEGIPAPNVPISIIFDYYEHTGDGDFFSVDSYIAAANNEARAEDEITAYEAIPVYAPIAGIPIDAENSPDLYIPLRDAVDFRPIVNTLATGSSADPSVLPSITSGKDATSATNFKTEDSNGNGFAPRMPLLGSNFECNIAFYQPKIDSLFMEKTGALTLVEGIPAEEPVAPPDLATGIRLYDFELPPYTFSINSIDVKKYNYKSYTMQDIVGLERRISRVEELVTLSLLEQSALNTAVKDAVTGLDRFKNGIVVDNFSDHSNGATGSGAYRASIDPVATHLRPPFNAKQPDLIEFNQLPAQRFLYGYRKEGAQIMLDYTDERILQNPFATRFINLQPYSIFTYEGEVELDPAIDTWKDTNRKPKLIINDTNVFDAMVNQAEELNDSGIMTVWGDWETTGKTKTNVNRRKIKGSKEQRLAGIAQLEASGVTVEDPQGILDRIADRGGKRTPPIKIKTTTKSEQLSRQATKTKVKVSSGAVKRTSYGDRIVDVTLADTMRTKAVRVSAGRLKPNTRYYIFFDDIDCTSWFAVDKKVEDDDGEKFFRGEPGKRYKKNKGFGSPIISDDAGNIAGWFIIPNGRPPKEDQPFGTIGKIEYKTNGPTQSFTTGTRKFRITSSTTDAQDLTQVEGFAETTYVSSGVILDKQRTIVATTIPKIKTKTKVTATDKRWEVTDEKTEANYYDPVAQTFMVDKKFTSGVFISELDVFFQTKDKKEGVEAYLVTTDGQVPTNEILPYSIVVKDTDSYLRVTCKLGFGVESETIQKNTEVIGQTSGATGIVKKTKTFNSADTNAGRNVDNNVYRLILKNYDGEFIPGEQIVPQTKPKSTSTFTIVQNEVDVDYVKVDATGRDYTDATTAAAEGLLNTTVTFSEPQLPGGETATGVVKVGGKNSEAEGRVYEVEITDPGSGYTKVPSATIRGTGREARVRVRVKEGEKAVKMGVSTSEDATAATTFRFKTPIYLLPDTTYGFVVKAPTSLEYRMFTSKIGETRIGTNRRVTEQPSLGSIFLSQNGSLWTEDQTIDVKFVLRRAKFKTNRAAVVNLVNEDTRYQRTSRQPDPITTNATPRTDPTQKFGDNPQIIKVLAPNHGFSTGDLVPIEGCVGNPGGIPDSEINTLHKVIDVGQNTFTVKVPTAATTSERSGGRNVRLTKNISFETMNVNTGAMVFGPTTLSAETIVTDALSPAENNRWQYNNETAFRDIKYRKGLPVVIDLLETYYFNRRKAVLSPVNEARYNRSTDTTLTSDLFSLDVNVYLTTQDDAVSPVINLQRTAATLVSNIISNAKPADPIFGPQEAVLRMSGDTSTLTTVTAGSDIAFTNKFGVSRTAEVSSRDDVLNRINLIGEYVNELSDNPTITTTAVTSLGVDGIDVDPAIEYIDETRNRGSQVAKWESRLFVFENECDGVSLKLSACIYTKDSIRCYYRRRDVGYDGDVSQINWVPFNKDQELITTVIENNVLTEKRENIKGLPDDVNEIKVRDADNLDPMDIFEDGWQTLTWTKQDMNGFDAIAIKIVMCVDNPALAPIIDDMQLICSE